MKVSIYQLHKNAPISLRYRNYDFTMAHGGINQHNYKFAASYLEYYEANAYNDLCEKIFAEIRKGHETNHEPYLSYNKPSVSDVFVVEDDMRKCKTAWFCNDIGWVNVTDEWFAENPAPATQVSTIPIPVPEHQPASAATSEISNSTWTNAVSSSAEYVSKDAVCELAGFETIWGDERRVIFEDDVRDMPVAPNVVEVVFCKDCIGHGKCAMEEVFLSAGIEQPFCCGGNKKNEKDN